MSETITVPANETGVLRLFALDMPREQIKFLREPGALDDVLGVIGIDPEHVEMFPVSDLDDLGLPGYLIEGHAVPKDQIDPVLADISGHVLLLHSRAFGGRTATLSPAASLSSLGVYTATPTNWSARPQLAPDSAKRRGGLPHPPRAARARARTIGGGIFVVVMLLVAIFVYMVVQ